MKQKFLLFLVATGCFVGANAQKNKKSKSVTAYAITAAEKGSSRWAEVRLVDVNTGEEVKSIYNSSEEAAILNARTGKPIVKKEIASNDKNNHEIVMYRSTKRTALAANRVPNSNPTRVAPSTNSVVKIDGQVVTVNGHQVHGDVVVMRKMVNRINNDAPFATQSAACAYDKKHNRLYYTPMGINQLRYIDLKSKNAEIFYFEDEAFGALKGRGGVPNQITRMVIGGDGNGYALSNNAEHLIRFTTNKKAEVTDLGGLIDDASNKISVHSNNCYGGDMVADKSGNLFLITANRCVFQVDIESKVATFKGVIKGLPRGFTTNGAIVESGTNIIVTSSTSTEGYYKFDLNTLQAEKISEAESVYNASDLANSNLITGNKKKKDEQPTEEEIKEANVEPSLAQRNAETSDMNQSKLIVYPNPVTDSKLNLSFAGYANGRYEVQVLDLNGKVIQLNSIVINNKSQAHEIRLPAIIAKGSYLVKVVNAEGKAMNAEKFIVQ